MKHTLTHFAKTNTLQLLTGFPVRIVYTACSFYTVAVTIVMSSCIIKSLSLGLVDLLNIITIFGQIVDGGGLGGRTEVGRQSTV